MASSPDVELALAGAVSWIVWSIVCGYVGHRLPRTRLEHDRWPLPLRSWERGGRTYQGVLGIKEWKDRLPEAGALFPGGFSKRNARHDRDYLESFLVETRRAELVHWSIFALAPMFVLWIPVFGMPWWLALAMVAYGVVANLPCILVQRYNRARLAHILSPRVATP